MPEDDRGATRGTVRSGMGFAASSFMLNAAVGVVSAIVTARVYGIDVIGQFALVTAPWLLLIQLSSMSEQKALTRELASLAPRAPRIAGLFFPVLAFSFVLTLIVAIPIAIVGVGALHGPMSQGHLTMPALALVAGYVLVDNTSWNLDAVLAAFLAGRELLWARLIQAAAFPVIAVALYPVSESVWALTVATLVSFAIGLLLRAVLVRRYMPLPRDSVELRSGMRELPRMLGFALRMLPSRLASGITSQAGIWILGSTSSIREVGSFARANSLAVRVNDAGFRVSEILFPALVDAFGRGDVRSFERLLRQALRLTAAPLFLAASVAGGVAAGLLDVFGAGFDDAADAFALLLVSYSVFVLVLLQSQAVVATGRPGTSSLIGVLRALVTVGLMVPLSAAWDGAGIGVSLLVGLCISWQLQARVLRRRVLHCDAAPDALFALGVVASTAAGFLVSRLLFLSFDEPVGIAVGGAGGAAAFVMAAVLTRLVRPREIRELLARRQASAQPSTSSSSS